jgi:hypothetical protein
VKLKGLEEERREQSKERKETLTKSTSSILGSLP